MVVAALPYRSQDLIGGAGARQFFCLPLAALLLWQAATALALPEQQHVPLPPAQIKLGLVAIAGKQAAPMPHKAALPVEQPVQKTISKPVVKKKIKPVEPVPVKPVVRPQSAVPKKLPARPVSKPVPGKGIAKKQPAIPHAAPKSAPHSVVEDADTVSKGKAESGQGNAAATVLHKASYRKQVPPVYPRRAVSLGQQGTVILHAEVLPNGTPRTIKIGESSGFKLLDRAAMSAVRKWRFEPALINGQIQVAWMRVPVNFQIR